MTAEGRGGEGWDADGGMKMWRRMGIGGRRRGEEEEMERERERRKE